MKNQVTQFINYEHSSNLKILGALRDAGVNQGRPLQLFSHILSMQAIWLARIKNDRPATELWMDRGLEECEQTMLENYRQWNQFLDTVDDDFFTGSVTFNFYTGEIRKINTMQGIYHMITHACYHRGQIVALLKPLLPELPHTSYVLFASEVIG